MEVLTSETPKKLAVESEATTLINHNNILSCKEIGLFGVLTGLLGGGRIISNIALVNQGMQQTFLDIGLQKSPLPQILSGAAAFANATSDSVTRLPSLYENIGKIYNKLTLDEIYLKVTKNAPSSSLTQNTVYYALISAGILDMMFFALNNFSALIQLQCQFINSTHCENGFDWPHITNFIPGAVICSLSTGLTFASFTLLDSLRKNANDTVMSFNNLSDAFKKTNNWVIVGTTFLGLLNALSLGATLFFSTSKMIFNLFGPTISEYKIMQTLVYISMAAAVTTSMFTWVAEGKKLLEGKKAFFREWFYTAENSVERKILAAILFPILMANVASHALNNFPGNIQILDKMFSGYEKLKMSLAITNSLSTAFLYFAFNTAKALSTVAGVPNEIPLVSNQAITPELTSIQTSDTATSSITTSNKWNDFKSHFENIEKESFDEKKLLEDIHDSNLTNKHTVLLEHHGFFPETTDYHTDDNNERICPSCVIF